MAFGAQMDHQQQRRRRRAFERDVVAGPDQQVRLLLLGSKHSRPAGASTFRAILGRDLNFNIHAQIVTGLTLPRSRKGRSLDRIAHHGDANQVAVADNAVCGIEFRPAAIGKKNANPGMSVPAAQPCRCDILAAREHR